MDRNEKMIKIMDKIAIEETEIKEEFIRASGPGGQKINKTATAVQLRFNVKNSPSLPDDLRRRLLRLAGRRLTSEGFLIIEARRFRTQTQNRRDALERLIKLIRRASRKPRRRRKTTPTPASRRRRLEAKRRRSAKKDLRKPVSPSED